MSYKKAEKVLPAELVELIQSYIDGEYLYIPRKVENKRSWGESTNSRQETELRNHQIYMDYLSGMKSEGLADKYFLSVKSIQRIILQEKRKCA